MSAKDAKAAQAVMIAATNGNANVVNDPVYRQCIAAALRVVADEGESFYDPWEGKTSAVRTDWILAIVAELEGRHG